MESVWPVSKLSTESVGSRRELVANSCTHRRRDKTVSSRRRRRCVLGPAAGSSDCSANNKSAGTKLYSNGAGKSVVTLLRHGELTDSSNYRPIALATIFSKTFEHVLLRRLYEYLNSLTVE